MKLPTKVDCFICMTLAAAIITALATAVLAVLTYLNVRTTNRLVQHQTLPNVVVRIEQLAPGSFHYCFVVENIGYGPAYDVQFDVQPLAELVGGGELRHDLARFLSRRLPVLHPERPIGKLFDRDKIPAAVEAKSEVIIKSTFRNSPSGKLMTSHSLVGFSFLEKQLNMPPGPERQLASIETAIRKGLGDITGSLREP